VKRPIPIYFVGVWSFIVLTLQTRSLAKLAESLLSDGQDATRLWSSFRGLLLILVIWHAVRLCQLRPFNRWLSTVSFFWAAISAIWFVFVMSGNPEVHLSVIVGSAISVLLSLAAGFYLVHRRFRDYAARFVAERDKERNSRIMQRISQKKVLKETQS
jgi:hypothetical protein